MCRLQHVRERELAYRVGIDTGGTFTDFVAIGEDGAIVMAKHPSTPRAPVDAFMGVIRKSGLNYGEGEIQRITHGTTVATNAVIQRQGAPVVLVATHGFEDVPFIQRINRKSEYDLQWRKPQPLVRRRWCIGARERLNARGEAMLPLSEDAIDEVVAAIRRIREQEPIEAIAVCLLFAYLNPTHELQLMRRLATAFPSLPVSLSHNVAPIWREYERSSTVLADAYVKPLVSDYCQSLELMLAEEGVTGHCSILKSDGGTTLLSNAARRPIDILLSGLAGGIVGGRYWARQARIADVVTLDMGGTSADVGLIIGGQQRFTTEFEIEWGLPVAVPIVEVRTLGAGGGSVAWIDKGGMLNVGPRSAGALPGPAAYSNGGEEPTVTDANLVLGRLNAEFFLGGEIKLDNGLARAAVSRVAERIGSTVEETAAAILDIADENMANAIRLATIDRGIDPRDFALVAFGGAGPLHAVAIAQKLGIPCVLVPPHPGLVSALGAAISELRVEKVRTLATLSTHVTDAELTRQFAEMDQEARAELVAEGLSGEAAVTWKLSMRYFQQNYEQDVEFRHGEGLGACLTRFHQLHHEFYGYSFPEQAVELVHLRLSVYELDRGGERGPQLREASPERSGGGPGRRPGWEAGGQVQYSVYRRSELVSGAVLKGPAIIEEVDSTTFVPSDSALRVDESGSLIISFVKDARS
jgi:N-methylhydantoinase A